MMGRHSSGMGDTRFQGPLRRVVEAPNPVLGMADLTDEEIVSALAGASAEGDQYLANVIASEAHNRVRRKSTIVEIAHQGLLSVDADGRVTHANPAAERILGHTARSLVGVSMEAFFTSDDNPLREATAQREGVMEEVLLERRDGSQFAALVSVAPIIHKEDVEGAVLAITDISARKRAEAGHRHLAAIIQSTEDAVFSVTREGIVTSWNRGAERLFGYTEAEVVGRSVETFIPADRREELEEMARVAQGTTLSRHESVRLRKDGSAFVASVTLSPIRDEAGRIEGVSAIVRDISDQKRLESDLRDAKEAVETIIATSPVPTITLDPEGRVLVWNNAAEEVFGWSRKEVEGQPLPVVPPERDDEFRRTLAALREGETFRSEERLQRRKDGSLVEVSLSLAPIEDPEGNLLYSVGVLEDITPRKRAEALERARLLDEERNARAVLERRLRVWLPAVTLGAATIIVLRTLLLVWFASDAPDWSDDTILLLTTIPLFVGGILGLMVYWGQGGRKGNERRERGGATP